jgi:signal transduction histidine kinase
MGQTFQQHAAEPGQHGRAGTRGGEESIVHDFRNLLQCATSALRVTRRRLAGHAEADLAANVGNALEALDRANLLAHRLLTRKLVETETVPVSITALILSLRGILRHAVGEDVRLETLVSGRPMPLRCDPHQLENVLVNLAVNARDAMPEGGVLIIESRECRHPGHAPHCIALSAIDTGCGMSPEVAEQATRPLFTTKPIGRGCGLGLSSVREFAEQLGGSVEIRTAQGSGTCIRIHLPTAGGGAWS